LEDARSPEGYHLSDIQHGRCNNDVTHSTPFSRADGVGLRRLSPRFPCRHLDMCLQFGSSNMHIPKGMPANSTRGDAVGRARDCNGRIPCINRLKCRK
jgi:hypothetical protein